MKIILQASDVSVALSAFLSENYNISVAPEAITLDIDEVVVEVNPINESSVADEAPVKRTRNRVAKGSSTPVVVADEKTDEPVIKNATPEPTPEPKVQEKVETTEPNPFADSDAETTTTTTTVVEDDPADEVNEASIFD